MKTSDPKDKIKVVLVEGVHPAGAALLRGEGFAVETVAGAPDEATLEGLVADAHLLGIRSRTRVTARILSGAKRLLAVGCFCIGTDRVDLCGAAGLGVPVFNSPFSNTRSVAELTIAEVVALHRRLAEKSGQMHAGVWDKSAVGAHEVRGRVLGIVGYGHIGSQVSVLGEAMWMRVIFHDVVARMGLGNARQVKGLGEVLKEADVVTLHVPATERTAGMIGAAEIKKMKEGACLINNARGNIVRVGALAAGIREGRLAGAAVDVFPGEPSAKSEPFESELRGLPNVILTPHVGGSTEEAQAQIADDACTKLIRFVNVGSTMGSVNVPEVELPSRAAGEEGEGPRPHRVLHFHRNVPGVLSKMHGLISKLGVNVSAEYLRTKDDLGYAVLDVDPTDGRAVLEALKEIPETIRVRLLW